MSDSIISIIIIFIFLNPGVWKFADQTNSSTKNRNWKKCTGAEKLVKTCPKVYLEKVANWFYYIQNDHTDQTNSTTKNRNWKKCKGAEKLM